MRTRAKSVFFILVTLCLLLLGINAEATSHRYDTGILSSVTEDRVVMSGNAYRLLPNNKVIFKERGRRGAYYEHKRSISDLRIGEKIFLKVIGNNILEIEVVR